MTQASDAAYLLDNKLLKECLDKLENSAKEQMVSAELNDHETRLNKALQVRAIRTLRADLQQMIAASNQRDKGAFA